MNILKSSGIAAAVVAVVSISGTAFAQNKTNTATVTDQQNGAANSDYIVNNTWKPSLVTDGVVDRVPHRAAALPWQPLREADVMWSKRLWREIDTREKENMAFRYEGDAESGGGSFIEILLHAIKNGKIQAYSAFGAGTDRFTSPLTPAQVQELTVGKPHVEISVDPITGDTTRTTVQSEFNTQLVTRYRIKEDWMMDRNLGRVVGRIIGIAPVIDVIDQNTGDVRGTRPLFWIYYPAARPELAKYEVFNPENDVNRLTWDDYLEGRFWHGRVIQESNPFNMPNYQSEGSTDMEALYRGQQVQEEIMNKESDLWMY